MAGRKASADTLAGGTWEAGRSHAVWVRAARAHRWSTRKLARCTVAYIREQTWYIQLVVRPACLPLPVVLAGTKVHTVSPNSHLHGGAHIVCADQKPEVLELIVQTLREHDHCVFQAYDGLAALELVLALRRIDLLITNTSMPGLNGPQLIRKVREQFPTLPILYVKNANSPDGGPQSLPSDVPTLREPFTPQQLLAAVRPLLVRD